MVTILSIKDGKYQNLPQGHRGYEAVLNQTTAKGYLDNTQTKETSHEAKEKAMEIAKRLEKDGWKLVCLLPRYSYGKKYAWGYDIVSWGGYFGK